MDPCNGMGPYAWPMRHKGKYYGLRICILEFVNHYSENLKLETIFHYCGGLGFLHGS